MSDDLMAAWRQELDRAADGTPLAPTGPSGDVVQDAL